MKRILIATDHSHAAAEAVSVGVHLAAEQGAAVTFVHVVPSAFTTRPGRLTGSTLAPPLPGHDDEIALNDAAELAREARVDADIVIVFGDAADEIVAFADTIDADMIIVGSRDRGAVKSLALGSVSSAILQEARRPVLVVPNAPQRRELVSNPTSHTRSDA